MLCGVGWLCSFVTEMPRSSLWAFCTIPKHQMQPPTRAMERSVRRQSMESLLAEESASGHLPWVWTTSVPWRQSNGGIFPLPGSHCQGVKTLRHDE